MQFAPVLLPAFKNFIDNPVFHIAITHVHHPPVQ